MWGETTRVENRGETTRGETTGPYNYQKALYTGKHYIPESTYNYQKAMGKSISRADDARIMPGIGILEEPEHG